MSLLERLKKIFKEEKKVKSNNEAITLENVYSKIEEKIKNNSEKSNQLKNEIINRVNKFNTEIKLLIEILEKLDISDKKEHNKIKLIVSENKNIYINQLKNLINNLNNIENLEFKEGVNKLFFIINEFYRKSHNSFEKATILIGKELRNIKELLNNFARDLNIIIDNNKKLFEEIEISEKLHLFFIELKKIKDFEEELKKKIENFNEEIKTKNKEKELIIEMIEKIKKSEQYIRDVKEKDEHKEQLNNLENELRLIKQKINFKLLAKYFHYDNKKSKIIIEYTNNFKPSIIDDKELRIIDLVKEAQGIELNSLYELRNRIIKISDQMVTQTDKEIARLETNLKELGYSIFGIRSSIEIETKKIEKIIQRKDKIIDEIKDFVKLLFPDIILNF